MAFSSTPVSLFFEGPTVEHIEYALPSPGSLHTTSTNTTYHHIQHFLPDGTPGASSTHIEYADDPSFAEPPIPVFTPRRPTATVTTAQPTSTRVRREQGSGWTSSSTSTSPSPPLHVRFAGDLPLARRHDEGPSPSSSSPSPPQATGGRSTSSSRPRLTRSRPSSPYPFLLTTTTTRGGGGGAPDVFAEEFASALGEESREGRGDGDGDGDGGEGGGRTGCVREDSVCGSGGGVG